MIFYTIYMKQQKHFTISVANCSQALEKIFFFAMWSSGWAAAVRRPFQPGEGRGVA
jgi:hypothetical protein